MKNKTLLHKNFDNKKNMRTFVAIFLNPNSMRKFIYTLSMLIITSIFTCCTRYELEQDVVVGDGANRLTIKLSPFEKSGFDVNPSSRAIVGIDEVCTIINFAVFDSNGKKVASDNQASSSRSDFGTFNADLNDGEYNIVIVAHSTAGNATISKPDSIRFTDNKLSDTFSYYEHISLKGNLTKEICMKRCVAMFRLQLTERIPQNIKFLKFYYTGGSSTLNATTGFGKVNSRQTEIREVPEEAYTSKNNIFEVYTIPHSTDDELKMTISGLAEDGKSELDQRVFENVPVTQGQITTFSGNIFNTGDAQDISSPFKLSITADNYWSEKKYSF